MSLVKPLSLWTDQEDRILQLIAANTWSRDWTGDEPLASEFEEPDFVQLALECGGVA